MVLENSHLASQGWLALPKQLDHKCAQNDRVQLHLQAGAGKPHV